MSAETKRIRGRALQRLRARVLGANPLCVRCQSNGKITVAVEVDHIVALVNWRGEGDPNADENLQGLCAPCHEQKTCEDLGQTPKIQIGIDGWPVTEAKGKRKFSSE